MNANLATNQKVYPSPLNKTSLVKSVITDENIKDSIGKFGTELQIKSTVDDGLKTRINNFIKTIKNHSDANKSASLFGVGTTRAEENLFLLKSAIDAMGNVNKHGMLKQVQDAIDGLSNKNISSYFNNTEVKEKNIIRQARDLNISTRGKNGSNPILYPEIKGNEVKPQINEAKKITVGKSELEVMPTKDEQNNCLYFAISKNADLPSNFRQKIFTPEEISRQLSQINKLFPGAAVGAIKEYDIFKNETINGEGEDGALSDEQLKDFSHQLSDHIITSNCFLDFQIAGGILAKQENKMIINVRSENGQNQYTVMGADGKLISHSEREFNPYVEYLAENLDKENVIFIHNSGQSHFEAMKKNN